MTGTRADRPTGTTYSAVPARPGTLCDWCGGGAAAIVFNRYNGDAYGRADRMCAQHLAEYHPDLTV